MDKILQTFSATLEARLRLHRILLVPTSPVVSMLVRSTMPTILALRPTRNAEPWYTTHRQTVVVALVILRVDCRDAVAQIAW